MEPATHLIMIYLFMLISGPISLGQEGDAKLAAQAQERAQAKDFEGAIALIKKASALAPRNDLYLALTSDYELKAGKFADGVRHAVEAMKLNDKEGAYVVLAAANAYWDQDLDGARAYCAQVLAKGPNVFAPRACQDAQYLQDLLVRKVYTLFWKLDPKQGPRPACLTRRSPMKSMG
jgi:tetratricopeptide (TPR) repeat protein